MNSHVTRFTVPDDPYQIRRMLEWSGETDLETLLNGTPVNWSLSKSVMINDVVWFQLTIRSLTTFRTALRLAREWRLGDVVHHLESIQELVESSAGHVVAVGLVSGEPEGIENDELHFKGRIAAEVHNIVALPSPVKAVRGAPICELPTFMVHGPLVNRLFGSDEEFQSFLTSVEVAGNALPDWAKRPITGPIRMKPFEHWLEDVVQPDLGFINEAQLAACWGTPLLREISDRRRVNHEVRIDKGENSGRVDAVCFLAGVPLPVEFKLDARLENRLAAQVGKYAGPAQLALGSRTVNTDHPYVVVIDRERAELWRGSKVVPTANTKLDRCDVTADAINSWSASVSESIQGYRWARQRAGLATCTETGRSQRKTDRNDATNPAR